MATIARGTTPVKEKRGASSSSAPQTGPKTNSSKPAQTNDSSGKNVPNYLKPTRSSGPDATTKNEGKRPVSGDGSHKPSLARRRSFDKPPPPSPTQKLRASPNLRSSSFSGKTTIASQKQVATDNKNLKSPNDTGKSRLVNAKPAVKKTTAIYVKKQDVGTSTASKTREQFITGTPVKVDTPNTPDFTEPETQADEDPESPIIKETAAQIGVDGSTNEEKADHVQVLEDEEETKSIGQAEAEKNDKIVQVLDVKTEEPEKEKTLIEETVSIEQAEAEKDDNDVKIDVPTESSDDVKTEEPQKEKSQIIEETDNQEEIKHTINEITSDHEIVAANPINEEVVNKEEEEAAVSDKKEEVAITSEAKEKDVEEATALDKKEELAIVSESKETDVQEAEEEQKKIPVNAVPKRTVAHGKKDTALSNDVIEETASKLREQRKNKVKALAGAFETVISLQEK